MDTERLWMEIALRDLTGQTKDAVIRTVKDIKAAMEEADKASGPSAETLKRAESFGKTLGDVAKTAVGVFTGIKLADVAKDFAEFHTRAIDGTAALVPLADRLGVTTDELQALQGAARRANVTNDELNKTVFTFTKNVGDANAGGKTQIETFEKLGIKIRDTQGNLRPMPDLLMETARALMNVDNTSTRASLGAALLGEKGARLTPLLRELGVPIAELVDRGRSFGEIVDREVAEKLDRAKNSSEAASQQLTALYATVAAPIQATALDFISEKIANIVRGLKTSREESDRLFATWLTQNNNELLKSMATGKPAELNVNQAEAQERERLAQRLAAAEARTVPRNPRQAVQRQTMIDEARRELEAFDAVAAARRKMLELPAMEENLRNGGLPAQNAPTTAGASNPRVTGGSSAEKRDRIGEALNQLRGEAEAAQAAYAALMKDTKTPLEDLEREVDLRKKIADELAKLGKYDPRDPRVGQIRDLVRAHEELEVKIKQREEAMKVATETERRMGDGQAYLAAEMQRLNEALDTGRLRYETYAAAVKEANEKAGDMDRKLRGSQGGVGGVMAGAEQAMKDWERANSAFETGKRAMNDGLNLLKQAGNDWATNGVVDIEKYGKAFIGMILNVGLALAQSELMKLLRDGGGGGGGIGGLGGGFSGLFGGGASGTASGLFDGVMDMAGFFPTFAEGGDYQAGVPRIVGENGWELDVPNTSGTILNQRQLASLLGGGGERRSQAGAQNGRIDIYVHENGDLLRLEIDNRSAANIARVAPQIEGQAVKRAGDQVVPRMNRHEAESGGDWRLAR